MVAPRSGLLAIACALLCGASVARATDVDGPDCGRLTIDYGDAPEGMPMYGCDGPTARYPTCTAVGAAGTQESDCPPRSTPPGPTGFIRHVQSGNGNYWLGCYNTPFALSGIDSEHDGKVSHPSGPSFCSAIETDCVFTPFLAGCVSFGQDECRGGGDAGVFTDLFVPCLAENYFTFVTTNCGPPREVYLNLLVDLNLDGDWNDAVQCAGRCAYEWAVKNHPVQLSAGCEQRHSPMFPTGPIEGTSWMRVSITDLPVDDDYPWAGSALRTDGSYSGGETEDTIVHLIGGLPARTESWGRVKTLYR